MSTYTVIESPIGPLTLAGEDGVLTGLHMGDRPSRTGHRDDTALAVAREQLAEYFAGDRTDFTAPTRVEGTDFQRKVWQVLTRIPYGGTWSYPRLADAIGRPDRLRAAAAANGRNPVPIVIPCHRVIGADGSLTGFAGGLARKRFLLELERPADQTTLF